MASCPQIRPAGSVRSTYQMVSCQRIHRACLQTCAGRSRWNPPRALDGRKRMAALGDPVVHRTCDRRAFRSRRQSFARHPLLVYLYIVCDLWKNSACPQIPTFLCSPIRPTDAHQSSCAVQNRRLRCGVSGDPTVNEACMIRHYAIHHTLAGGRHLSANLDAARNLCAADGHLRQRLAARRIPRACAQRFPAC